jgi:hypothetical protein
MFTLAIRPNQRRMLEELARRTGKTKGAIIRTALDNYLEKQCKLPANPEA